MGMTKAGKANPRRQAGHRKTAVLRQREPQQTDIGSARAEKIHPLLEYGKIGGLARRADEQKRACGMRSADPQGHSAQVQRKKSRQGRCKRAYWLKSGRRRIQNLTG